MITSCAPMPFILSYMPSPWRFSSPSMPSTGNLLGTTRTRQPGWFAPPPAGRPAPRAASSARCRNRTGKARAGGGTGWRMKSDGPRARSVEMITQRPVTGSFVIPAKLKCLRSRERSEFAARSKYYIFRLERKASLIHSISRRLGENDVHEVEARLVPGRLRAGGDTRAGATQSLPYRVPTARPGLPISALARVSLRRRPVPSVQATMSSSPPPDARPIVAGHDGEPMPAQKAVRQVLADAARELVRGAHARCLRPVCVTRSASAVTSHGHHLITSNSNSIALPRTT